MRYTVTITKAHSQTTEDIDPVHWINEDPLMYTFICSASAPRGADCLFCLSTETVYFFLLIKTSLMHYHFVTQPWLLACRKSSQAVWSK